MLKKTIRRQNNVTSPILDGNAWFKEFRILVLKTQNLNLASDNKTGPALVSNL
jgi:hypothetical protein